MADTYDSGWIDYQANDVLENARSDKQFGESPRTCANCRYRNVMDDGGWYCTWDHEIIRCDATKVICKFEVE